MASSVKCLFNVPTQVSVRELVFRRTGLLLDDDFATYTFANPATHVTVGTRAHAADGRRSPYVGEMTLPLNRLDIGGQLPDPLIWSDNYPTTVQQFADYLYNALNYYFEDGEFFGVGDAGHVPLVRGAEMTAVVDHDAQTFTVEVTPQAARWLPGTQLTFKLVTANSLPGQDNFSLTGAPPDAQVGQAYDFTYTVTNGTPPFRFQVLQGEAPIVPSPTSGRMLSSSVDSDVGAYNWIMQVTDATGRQATLRCSMSVAASVLQFNPPSRNPVVSVGVQSTIPMGISGGLLPYTLEVYAGELPNTVALNSSQMAGVFDGSYTAGQTSRQVALGVRLKDSSGQQVDRLFNITVNNRSDAQVVASLKTKLAGWYGTPVDALTNGVTWPDLAGHSDLSVTGSLGKVTGPHGTDFGLNFANGYAQAFAAVHNYTSAFTVVSWTQMGSVAGNQHLISKKGTNSGWALSKNGTTVDVLAVTGNGLQDAAFAEPTLTDGQWHLVMARITPATGTQRFASVSMEGNSPLVGNLFDGTLLPNTTQPLTVGQSPALDAKYTGALCDPVLFSDTLWSDEMRWFANSGAGRRYWDLIDVATLSISGSSVASQVGQSPVTAYTVVGGVAPYSYRISAGTLPPGRTLNQDGTVTGAYTTGADYNWTVEVTDQRGVKATVTDHCLIGWRTLTLTGTYPGGETGSSYSADLTIAGGDGTYTHPTTISGTLPSGATLSIVGNKLRLSGNLSVTGVFAFTVGVDSGDGQHVTSDQSVTITDSVAHPTKLLDMPLQGVDGSTVFTDRVGHPISATNSALHLATDVDGNGALLLDGSNWLTTPVTADMPVVGTFDMEVEFYPTENKGFFVSTPFVEANHFPSWVFGFAGSVDNPGDQYGTSPYFGFAGSQTGWFVARSGDGVVQLNQWNRFRGVRSELGTLLIYANDVLVGTYFAGTLTPSFNLSDLISFGRRWDDYNGNPISKGYMRAFSFTKDRPHLSGALIDSRPDHYWTGEQPLTDWGTIVGTTLTAHGTFAVGTQLGAEPIKSLYSDGSASIYATVPGQTAAIETTLECAIAVTSNVGTGGLLLTEGSSTAMQRALYVTADMKPGFIVRAASGYVNVVAPTAVGAYSEALVAGRITTLDSTTQRVELLVNGIVVASQDVATLPTYTTVKYYLVGGDPTTVQGLLTGAGLTAAAPTLNVGKFAVYSHALTNTALSTHYKAFRRLSAAPAISGSLPQGMQLTSYSAGLSLSGGDGTFVNPRCFNGALPKGMKLSISGNTLIVAGVPQTTFNGNVILAVTTGDGQTVQVSFALLIAATDTAAIRRSLRTKITSFWDFNGDALDKARAGQHLVRTDGQPIVYVTGVNGRKAAEGQHVANMASPASLGVNAVHGGDAWSFGARLRPVDLGNFFISVADAAGGLKNELMAIGFTLADNAWQGTVRDSTKTDIPVKGPTGQLSTRNHVTMACDGTSLMLYVDAVQVATVPMPQTPLRYSNTLYFSVQNYDSIYHSAAEVSEMFYAHDVLTPTEIGYLANAGQGHVYSDFGNEAYLEASYTDAIGALNPDAQYALAETSGTSAVNSKAGFGNGTYSNASLGALEAPYGVGGKAARFAGNAGMKLPATLDLGQGDITLMAFHRPEVWTTYGRLFHLGDSASGNAGAMTINNVTNAGRYMAETFAPSTGTSYGAANGVYAPVPTAQWGQVALQYTQASKRLAVLWNGLTLEACIQTGNWASGAKAQAYLMRSGVGEYGNGAMAQATFFKSKVKAADLCKLTDFALPPLSLTGSLPTGNNQRSYTGTLTITGGQLPLASVVVSAGSLPTGLTATTSGRTVTIAGTIAATFAGTAAFRLTVTDATGTVYTSGLLTLTVNDTVHLLSRMRFNGSNGTAEVLDDVSTNLWSAVNGATLSGTVAYEGSASLSCIIGGVQCATNPLSEVATRDFTVRGLIYPLSTAGSQLILRTGLAGTSLYYENGKLTWYENGSLIFTSTSTAPVNAWTPFVLQRANGKIFAAFSGASETAVTSTADVSNTAVTFALGFNTVGTKEFFNGYLDFVEMFSTADATRIAQLGLTPLHIDGVWSSDITQSTAYSSAVAITGASGGYTPSVSVGSLPPGMSQSVSGGQWILSGVPTLSGAFRFTVTLTAGDGQTFSREVSGTIKPSNATGGDYETEVAKDTPYGWWKLNDVTGNVITDSSGNGKHGATALAIDKLVGPSLLPSGKGSSMGFGLGVQAQLPNLFIGNSSNVWAFEVIILPMSWPTQDTISSVAQISTGGSGAPEVDIQDLGDGTFRLRVMQSGVGELAVQSMGTKYPYGRPLHLVLRYNGVTNTTDIFVNGAKVATAGTGFASTGGYWELGSASFGSSIWNYPFLGYMSQVAFYNTLISDARILAHAQAMAVTVTPTTIAKGLWKKLEAWYKLDDAAGSNTLVDVFGGHNLITNGTVVSKAGKVGNAVRMSGGNYAQAARGKDMAFNRNFAIAAWLQTDSGVENRQIVSKWGGNTGFALGTSGNGTVLQINAYDGTSRNYPINSGVTIANNGWHFIVMERAFHRFNGYMDQSATAQASYAITMNDLGVDTSVPLTLWQQANSVGTANTGWTGDLDNVAIFNDALTADERAYLATGPAWEDFRALAVGVVPIPASIYTKLVGWWEADQLLGSIVDRHVYQIPTTGDRVSNNQATPIAANLSNSTSLNGGNDRWYALHPKLALANEAVAVLWTRPGLPPNNYPKYMWKGGGANDGSANYLLQWNNQSAANTLAMRVSTAGNPYNDASTGALTQGSPYMLLGQRKGANVEMYVNGAKTSSTPLPLGERDILATDDNYLTWGYRYDPQDPVKADVFPAMVFRSALTQDEIDFLYNAGAGISYAQLIAALTPDAYAAVAFSNKPLFYYSTLETGGVLKDTSGNGNTATPADGTALYHQPSIRPDGAGFAVELDGATSFTVPQQIAQQTTGWVSFWALPDITSGEMMLYSENVSAGPSFQLKPTYLNGGVFTWEADNLDSSGTWHKQWSSALDPTVAHHVLVTWDATHKCIYVDGVQMVNVAENGRASYGTSFQYIGREFRGLNTYTPAYKGKFQGLCGGSGLLTADQAAAFFTGAGGISQPGITSRYWKLNILKSLDGNGYMNLGYIGLRGEPGGANLAFNNPTGAAKASSIYASAWDPIYAFNRAGGNDAGQGFWHSASQASPWWVTYDFGRAVTLREIAIQSWNVQGRVPSEFEVQTSDDGVTWSTVAAFTVTNWDLNAIKSFSLAKGNALAASLLSKTVAWWPLDETTGTVLKDVHAGNNLTLSGAKYALAQPSIRAGGSATLQWTGDTSATTYANGGVLPASVQGPKDRALYTWWKSTSFSGQSTPMEGYTGGEDEPSNVQFELIIDTSKRLGTLWENGAGDNITTVGPTIDTNGHFIGYSMDVTNKQVTYTVDNIDSAAVGFTKPPSGGSTARFWIGTVDSGSTGSFGYQQDSVLFSQQLTVEEKRWLYNAGRGRGYSSMRSQALTGSVVGAALYDALVSWWEFKKDGVDSHGYNPFQSVTASQLVAGKLGNARYAPNAPTTASVLDVKFVASGGGALVLWYKPVTPSIPQIVAQIGNGNSRGECMYLGTSATGVLSVGIRDGNSDVAVNPQMAQALDTTAFHFLVVQKTPTGLEFWVDNALVASAPVVMTSLNGFDRFCLGSSYSGYGAAGVVNQPAWFNRNLTADEIAYLWNGGKGLTYGQLAALPALGTDAYSTAVLAKKPVGYWRLNDTGTIAVDSSGNGLHGTYTANPAQGQNSILPSGKGKSMLVNSSTTPDPYVRLPDVAKLNAMVPPFTQEAWIRPSALSTGVIFSGGQSGSAQLALSASSGSGLPYMGAAGVSNASSATTAAAVGSTTHVVASVSAAGAVTYYVNGALAGGPFAYGTAFTGSGPGAIGRYALSDSYPFKGYLQEVAVYDHAFTQAEAMDNYTIGSGT